MGSIPTEGARYQRCSPDGVGLVEKLGNKIVSFEYKAPVGRIPNGDVPPYYECQVMSCLCAVVPSDVGIFVDMSIRHCSADEWNFTNLEYNKDYHRNYKFREVYGLGMVYIFNANIDAEVPEDIIDYGASSKSEMMEVLKNCAELKTMRAEYSDICLPGEVPTNEVPEGCIGIIPVKIMRCVIVPIEKDPAYVSRYQEKIDKIIDIIRMAMEIPICDRREFIKYQCNIAQLL